MVDGLVIFGVRSPLVIEYEESCRRAGIAINAGVSVSGAPRMMDRSRVVTLEEFDATPVAGGFLACAFLPKRRRELAELARQREINPAAALIDPTAVVAASARLGEGSFVNALAVVGGLSLIGDGVFINRSVSIGHHTIIGDYVSLGPGAVLASNIRVGEGAVIGAGAILQPNVSIGAGAVIAAGALVRSDVPDDALAYGSPAKTRPYDWQKSSLNPEGDE